MDNYKEALEKAKSALANTESAVTAGILRNIFPELAESEDEKIRKELLDFCKNRAEYYPNDPKYENISAWIAWLEKQGEQKPIHLKFRVGDTIRNIKYPTEQYKISKIDKWCYISGETDETSIRISILDQDNWKLVEQKPIAWSEEDEKIRKELLVWLKSTDGQTLPIDRYNAAIAWLEKQGEQKPLTWKHWKDGIAGNGEGKPIYLIKDGLNYSISSCLGFECDYIELSELDKLLSQESQGEQKPSEDEDREYVCQSSEHYTRRELMIYNLGIADGKRMIEDAIKETEQKPAWSGEDEKMIDLLIAIFRVSYPDGVYKVNPIGTTDMQGIHSSEIIKWLKSLKDRCIPQPQQEWSEEDETMLALLHNCIGHYYADDIIKKEQQLALEDWLKSLRPQKKEEWSQKDIDMIDWLIRCCEKEHEELCNDRYGHQDIVSDLKRDCRKKWDWLESLKEKVVPQKQWKPSEEQISVLEFIMEDIEKDSIRYAVLNSVLEQLKKLKG